MKHHHPKKLHHHRHRSGERELDVEGSTCVAAAYYSRKGGGVLTIEFQKGGGVYQYAGVSKATAKAIEREDAGEVLNTEVLGN